MKEIMRKRVEGGNNEREGCPYKGHDKADFIGIAQIACVVLGRVPLSHWAFSLKAHLLIWNCCKNM